MTAQVGMIEAQANSTLDSELGTSYFQLHTGQPGAAGTANVASTTRVQGTWSAAAAGSKAISTASAWTDWADGSVTLTHVSVWSAGTAGTCRRTGQLTTPRAIVNGDTFSLDTCTVAFTPIATSS